MKEAGIDGSCEKIVCSGDGVDVACKVEVEFFHGYDLGVSSSGCSSFDSEGGALGWLTDAGEAFLSERCAECLCEADGGGCDVAKVIQLFYDVICQNNLRNGIDVTLCEKGYEDDK